MMMRKHTWCQYLLLSLIVNSTCCYHNHPNELHKYCITLNDNNNTWSCIAIHNKSKCIYVCIYLCIYIYIYMYSVSYYYHYHY